MPTSHNIAMALRAAYWTMHRRADAALEPHRVTADQFVLLSLLAKQDGITQQELVRRASSDANTVRAMLLLLERRGLISRRPHPTDGRARNVALTPTGRRRYTHLWNSTREFRRRLIRLFAPNETQALADYLGRIAKGMTLSPHARRPSPRTAAMARRGRRRVDPKPSLRSTER